MILASGSRWFCEALKKFPFMKQINVPKPHIQYHENHSDDQVARILKYLYSNQDFNSIADEVSDKNVYQIYA